MEVSVEKNRQTKSNICTNLNILIIGRVVCAVRFCLKIYFNKNKFSDTQDT